MSWPEPFRQSLQVSAWNSCNGKLKLTFKRPSELYPSLDLTDTLEVTALVASEKPGGSDRLILWVGSSRHHDRR